MPKPQTGIKGRYHDDLPVDPTIGIQLRKTRRDIGQTQEQYACFIGVSSKTLNQLERGRLTHIRRETAVLLGWLQ